MEPTSILLAEDEVLIGLAVQEALEEGGFTVDHQVSGADALSAIRGAKTKLSGLITGIELGDGPDGWDIARHAREASPTLPVLYVSAAAAHEHSLRGVPDSMMLQKPFAIAQLVTAISTLINAVPHRAV